MSFQLPPQDSYWRASRNSVSLNGPDHGPSRAGVFGSFFQNDRPLPVYKDKPYFAPRRTGPRLRRRRVLYGIVILIVVASSWWYTGGLGLFRWIASREATDKGLELWEWIQSLEAQGISGSETTEPVNWEARRMRVRDAFIVSWDGYEKYAWGFDEYNPISKKGRHMVDGGMGWIIVDALDTLMIMNLTSRVQDARNWIQNSLRYNQDHDVNTFETTIRMLGGLLSAHYLSTSYPDLAPIKDDDAGSLGEDLYIEKATDLAERLLGAFDSKTGIPYASVNLNQSVGLLSHTDGGASSTAEATTVQLEFKYLAKLTGEPEFWTTVEKVMQVVDSQEVEGGLVPIFIHPDTGHFRDNNIRLGSRGDSYYEYLIKQYLQTSKQEPIYKEMWDEALMGVRKHLITFTRDARLMIIGERPSGLQKGLSPKMDHLVCFMPGTIALGATGGLTLTEAKKLPDWTQRQDEEMLIAKELMKTCWATYVYTKTGLAPEITYFEVDNPPREMESVFPDSTMATGNRKSEGKDLPLVSAPIYPLDDEKLLWREDITIQPQDRHNLQRPETVESLFYMYRITGDETYRHWGWEMFKSFIKHTAVVEEEDRDSSQPSSAAKWADQSKPVSRVVGFTSLSNVNIIPATQRDNMESFWLAETLKYFYLLFSDRDFIPLEETVFNTEAHPLPRFTPHGDLQTGWTRQPRRV